MSVREKWYIRPCVLCAVHVRGRASKIMVSLMKYERQRWERAGSECPCLKCVPRSSFKCSFNIKSIFSLLFLRHCVVDSFPVRFASFFLSLAHQITTTRFKSDRIACDDPNTAGSRVRLLKYSTNQINVCPARWVEWIQRNLLRDTYRACSLRTHAYAHRRGRVPMHSSLGPNLTSRNH